MDKFPRRPVVVDPDKKQRVVREAYNTVGSLMDDLSEPALLVDALCMDGPIVGATRGFLELTGYKREDILGMNCRLMLRGVPEVAISKSARKNIRDYCGMCQIAGLKEIGETNALQPNSRQDGSVFVNLFILGLCMVQGHPYILSVQIPMGEGFFVRLRQVERTEAAENARNIFKRIRENLRTGGGKTSVDRETINVPSYLYQPLPARPDFAFFAERLEDHCLLINDGFTAIRREPDELATNCLVYGNRPVQKTSEGLSFSVRIDLVTLSFVGLPILGFTKRRPMDGPGLYPAVAKCLGASVLIGACGDAFARDKHENYKMVFQMPSESEVQTWSHEPGVPSQKRTLPCSISSGDVLQCLYTWDGRIQLLANDAKVLDFDVGRPLESGTDYYAVVDVCYSAYCVTLLPSSETSTMSGDTEELDAHERFLRESSFASEDSFVSSSTASQSPPDAPKRYADFTSETHERFMDILVKEAVVKQGIKAAVAQCNFCVTIADPRGTDCPLIAVSEEFERMTGFSRKEALGVNCRFLNQNCDCNPADLVNLRISSETGAPFTAVLPNRKKSGEMFLNLLDLRGLSIARDLNTGEDVWFLIGIQADVTDLTEEDVPPDHLEQMQKVSDSIRALVAQELSEFAVAGANQMDLQLPPLDGSGGQSCILLNRPEWRPGAPLGSRRPDDAPAKDFVRLTSAMTSSRDSPMERRLSPPSPSHEEAGPAAKSPPPPPSEPGPGRAMKVSLLVLTGVSLLIAFKLLRR